MKTCSVHGCHTVVSHSQEFCARCWNEVPSSVQYKIGVLRDKMDETRRAYLSVLEEGRIVAGGRIRA